MTNAKPQAPETLADMCDRVAQSIVAAVAATLLQPHGTYRQVQFIVHNQDFFGRDLEEIADLTNREAAAVHIRGGLEQRDFAVGHGDASGLARELAVIAKLSTMAAREQVHEPETRIVACH